jgi:hypothetical protein
MSDIYATRKACGAEQSPAECRQGRASRVKTEPLRKRARDTAGVLAGANPEAAPSKARVQQRSATNGSVGKSAGRFTAAKAAGSDSVTSDLVKSVAELAPMIFRDPENRKKRVKLAEALREHGLDESKVAAVYASAVEKLSRNKEAGAVGVAAVKLLLDVLKELTHSLEPQKAAGNSDSSDAPPFIRLIHNVPRPVRTE